MSDVIFSPEDRNRLEQKDATIAKLEEQLADAKEVYDRNAPARERFARYQEQSEQIARQEVIQEELLAKRDELLPKSQAYDETLVTLRVDLRKAKRKQTRDPVQLSKFDSQVSQMTKLADMWILLTSIEEDVVKFGMVPEEVDNSAVAKLDALRKSASY